MNDSISGRNLSILIITVCLSAGGATILNRLFPGTETPAVQASAPQTRIENSLSEINQTLIKQSNEITALKIEVQNIKEQRRR
jgi:hypothetical protein